MIPNDKIREIFVDHGFSLNNATCDDLKPYVYKAARALIAEALRPYKTIHTLDDYHEDYGNVLWWTVPVCEPPYCGTPNDSDWPGYHTRWTPLITPDEEQGK